MTDGRKSDKARLRRAMGLPISSMPKDARIRLSSEAFRILAGQPVWIRSKAVLLYASLTDELDSDPLIRDALAAGKTVALPRYLATSRNYEAAVVRDPERDLQTGNYGIREPRATCPLLDGNRLDFALVPGVAFTLDGRRLGRGKGHYDRLLAMVSGFHCGIAYDLQIVEDIPMETHDVRLDCILTPSRWCPVSPRAVLK